MIDEKQVGKSTFPDLYEYHYYDYTYESKHGLDLEINVTQELGREHKKMLKAQETKEKEDEKAFCEWIDMVQKEHAKQCKRILTPDDMTTMHQKNQKGPDFQNHSGNTSALQATFNEIGFNIIKHNQKKKKAGHGKKKAEQPKPRKVMPLYVQLECSLFLGCERISQFSYT